MAKVCVRLSTTEVKSRTPGTLQMGLLEKSWRTRTQGSLAPSWMDSRVSVTTLDLTFTAARPKPSAAWKPLPGPARSGSTVKTNSPMGSISLLTNRLSLLPSFSALSVHWKQCSPLWQAVAGPAASGATSSAQLLSSPLSSCPPGCSSLSRACSSQVLALAKSSSHSHRRQGGGTLCERLAGLAGMTSNCTAGAFALAGAPGGSGAPRRPSAFRFGRRFFRATATGSPAQTASSGWPEEGRAAGAL
mmetsp:Transcript_56124/g.163982  ORF Transcript_56124/g.163982 Transcript_56124/m.163982 type:complete len:246 (-) Transcript_56124:394-1131(-)